MIIPFGQFTPDLSDLNNVGSPLIKNVFPGGPYNGSKGPSYLPVPSFQTITGINALDARPRGAISATDATGNVFNFVGDATKLYQLTGTNWGDVTNVGGNYVTGADERWQFVQWKEKIIATNYSDDPQSISFGDANFVDLTTALRFRHVAVIRDFVVAGNTFDVTDNEVPYRVRWSAFNDETDWTVSAVTLSDFQDLKGTGGWIQGISGGDFGVIIQERAVYRMTFVGSPVVFQFDLVAPNLGTLIPGSIVQHGSLTFFLSQNGFVMLVNGILTGESWIGHNKVDNTTLADLDTNYYERVYAAIDPNGRRVLWAYPGAGNVGGRPNKILVYDWINRTWSLIESDVELLWIAASAGYTLDGLDDFALGAELSTNGTFTGDTDWTKGTGWTITTKAIHASGTGSDIEQTVTITDGDYYRVEFDVGDYVAGSVTPKVGGTAGTAVSGNVTDNKETILAGAGTLLEFTATSDFDGSLDNVSLKRVTPLDDLTAPLDSRAYTGGSLQLAAFDKNFKSGFFDGVAMSATLDTKEHQFNDGRRSHLKGFVPLVDEGDSGNVTLTARVGKRDRQSEKTVFGNSLSLTSSGKFTPRAHARYHRMRVQTSGDFDQAVGVLVADYDVTPGGRRGG